RARVDRSPSATSRWRTRSSASPPSAPPPWDSESSPFDRCYAPRVEDRNRAHHRRDRLGAKRRFDEVECTVSHLLRFPHPALGGRHPRWSGLRADCLDLPLASHSIDGLVLANEVIADLPVESGRNTGAIRLIGELARVLRSGGAALLTEFGGDFAPGPIRLLGAFAEGEHVEWSIDFRQLRAA